MPASRTWHVVPSLVLALGAAFVLPSIEPLHAHAPLVLLLTALAIAILASIARAWADVVLAAFAALSVAVAWIAFGDVPPARLAIRATATLAFLYLSATLLLGPWARFRHGFARLLVHRRHVGVAAYLLGAAHAALTLQVVFGGNVAVFTTSSFLFFGFTLSLTLLALAVTSWNLFQHRGSSRWWGVAHAAVIALWSVAATQLFRNAGDTLTVGHAVAIGAMGVYGVLIAPWALPALTRSRVSGWTQMHRLVWIAYLAIILHGGSKLAGLPLWVQLFAWGIVALVLGSHAAGWIRAWTKHRP